MDLVRVDMENYLTCPICRDLFEEPVLLSCSHSFCKDCVLTWWRHKRNCPVCKEICEEYPNRLTLNRDLKNLVQMYKEKRDQPECSLHSEKLLFICQEHEEPVCLVCKTSETHKDHTFTPIEEAAQDLREQLNSSNENRQEHLLKLNERRGEFENAAAHIPVQTQSTKRQIKAEFEKRQQFLRDEEESRVKALEEEAEQKIQRMKNKMAALSKDIETVSETISDTEELLRAADRSFLLKYKTAAKRARCPLGEVPQMEQEALINQARHLGNLGFNTWRKMKRLHTFSPVVLDPNTAGRYLILSDDLTSVRAGERQNVLKNPERIGNYTVDGSQSFSSGTHSWDVEIGDNKEWAVGVRGSVQRGENAENGSWLIRFTEDKYSASSYPGEGMKDLSVKNLRRVRVKLNFDAKTVTFTDPDTNTDLHTVTDTFTGGIRPFLRTSDAIPLKILSKDICVNV